MSATSVHSAPGGAPSATRRDALVRRLCLGIVALATLEFLVATTGYQILRLPPSTDFATYYLAGVQARDKLSPYDTAALARKGHALGFAHEQFPYLYPPAFALAMQPLARLSYPRARQVWMLGTTLALLAALGVTALLLRAQAARLGLQSRQALWILLAAFVPMALNSSSVHNDIRAGSVGIVLYLALASVAWGLVQERRGVTGLGLGLAALVKLTPLAAVAYVAWRRRRGAAALAAILLGIAMLAALVHWGLGIVPESLQAWLAAARLEYPRPMNQSLDAVLSRLLVANTEAHSFFDVRAVKQVLSLLASLIIVLLTLRPLLRPRQPALLPVELGYVTLALLMVMKITWVQTLAAMLFVWPCAMLAILRAAECGAPWARAAGFWASLGFFLSSAHFPILWPGWRHGPQAVVLNVHFAGVLILWLVSRWLLAHEEDCSGVTDRSSVSKIDAA